MQRVEPIQRGLLQRIGLFGGTFDPIHFGHLRTAEEVKEKFSLDKIYLIPASIPPHKKSGAAADPQARLEMIRRAIDNYPDFAVSDVELKRAGPSYTIDTLSHFKTILAEDSSIFLILGLDAFLEIDTWKCYRDLFRLAPLIVMARPGNWSRRQGMGWHILEDYLKKKISLGYTFAPSQACYVHNDKPPVFFAEVTGLDISSTKIRTLIKEGRSIRFLLPAVVENLIMDKGHYR